MLFRDSELSTRKTQNRLTIQSSLGIWEGLVPGPASDTKTCGSSDTKTCGGSSCAAGPLYLWVWNLKIQPVADRVALHVLTEKNTSISGPTQFKSVFFKVSCSHLCTVGQGVGRTKKDHSYHYKSFIIIY